MLQGALSELGRGQRLRFISGAPLLLAEVHRVVASMLADRRVRATAALQRRFTVAWAGRSWRG